jgi:hypothetical protein
MVLPKQKLLFSSRFMEVCGIETFGSFALRQVSIDSSILFHSTTENEGAIKTNTHGGQKERPGSQAGPVHGEVSTGTDCQRISPSVE